MPAEAIELETYRFWHLDYGDVAYYDQLVFKRHRPRPAETDTRSDASNRATGRR